MYSLSNLSESFQTFYTLPYLLPSMIFFEIAVPNISITDYLYFLPLILSQDFNQLPPLSKGTAKIHIFSVPQNFWVKKFMLFLCQI